MIFLGSKYNSQAKKKKDRQLSVLFSFNNTGFIIPSPSNQRSSLYLTLLRS